MKRIVTAISFVLLAGCSAMSDLSDETKGMSAEEMYLEAKNEMDGGNLTRAIQMFEKLEARYPYGRYAQQAQLEIAYAHYKDGDPALALAACDRFIKMHPTHENVDYAYYLKGLINFIDDAGFMSFISRQDMTERDPRSARESYEAFNELVFRFPNSKYSADARQRMSYLVNALAANEVHVARYYLHRGAALAAANRAQQVVVGYPRSPEVEEALAIMVQSYDQLNLTALRDDARKVLDKNFPQSQYLPENRKRFWWN